MCPDRTGPPEKRNKMKWTKLIAYYLLIIVIFGSIVIEVDQAESSVSMTKVDHDIAAIPGEKPI